jgi:hypothetical protein
MRRRGAILIATAFLALTVFAGPASAGNAKKCDKRQTEGHEIKCCIKRGDSPQEEKKCINRDVR